MDEKLKKELTAKSKWLRAFFMLLFIIVNYFLQMVIWIVAAFQFIASLLTGGTNKNLELFSNSLSQYAYQILQFLTYNTEQKPYPFDKWPKAEKTAAVKTKKEKAKEKKSEEEKTSSG